MAEQQMDLEDALALADELSPDPARARAALLCLRNALASHAQDTERLNWLEGTFSGVTNRERYLPVQMIWGKGCNGRSLREAIDKQRATTPAPEQPHE